MNSKRLHTHAIPIVVLSVGLLLVSMVGMSQLIVVNANSSNNLTRLLTERLFSLHPATNGLFHISRYSPSEESNSQEAVLQPEPASLSVDLNAAGKLSELRASLPTANPSATLPVVSR